ncbi:MAG: aminotransferase class V-fold PLP-dependent enzyme [Sphingobacteriales bacterium]|nr:MAG: aminotransferase class V-fold PLP-dependent enzyme [Sphingobacteriales bacterium]
MLDLNTTVLEETIDPNNWEELRATGHQMLDDMIDYIQQSGDRKVWQPIPESVKQALDTAAPQEETDLKEVYQSFQQNVLPYALGNTHPRFWGWVMGGGSATGMFADMLAGAMNASPSFGEHVANYVEKQVLDWTKEMYGFPKNSSGILTTGASLANILALTTARNFFNGAIRKKGIRNLDGQLVVYASTETHSCLQKAVELLGIGSEHLRKIAVDENYQVRIDLLEEQLKQDKANGFLPFCIVGNAGTVNTGAIDDLEIIAAIAKREGMWFHVDGAFGAVPKLLPEYTERLKGVELADSLAFDYHKWFYVNYDVGGVLIKNAQAHKEAFEINANYLAHHERGIIAGELNYNHLGIELSRGFRALKVWMILKEQGIEKYRRMVRQNIQQANYLAELVNGNASLQLMAPVPMNIVNFRFYRDGLSNDELNTLNKEILMQLHESGIAAPSFTILKGSYVIRVAITNHRSKAADFDILVNEVQRLGERILNRN